MSLSLQQTKMEVGQKRTHAWMASETWYATILHHLEKEPTALAPISKTAVGKFDSHVAFVMLFKPTEVVGTNETSSSETTTSISTTTATSATTSTSIAAAATTTKTRRRWMKKEQRRRKKKGRKEADVDVDTTMSQCVCTSY